MNTDADKSGGSQKRSQSLQSLARFALLKAPRFYPHPSHFAHTPSRSLPAGTGVHTQYPGKGGAGCLDPLECAGRSGPVLNLSARCLVGWAGNGKGRNAGGAWRMRHFIYRRYVTRRLPAPLPRGTFFDKGQTEQFPGVARRKLVGALESRAILRSLHRAALGGAIAAGSSCRSSRACLRRRSGRGRRGRWSWRRPDAGACPDRSGSWPCRQRSRRARCSRG